MIARKFRLCRVTGESRLMEKAVESIPRGPGMRHREGPGSSLIRARLPSGHDSGRGDPACSPLRLAGPNMIRSGADTGVSACRGADLLPVTSSAEELRGVNHLGGAECRCGNAREVWRQAPAWLSSH